MRGTASTENISPRMALVMSEGLATLRELQTVYSYRDLMMMSEVCMVNSYNEWCSYKSAEESR